VTRGRVERAHPRALGTMFGEVTVSRMAYRAPGHRNPHPADAALNLPVERHSHGLRKLAAVEAAHGSFQDAVDGIERACGQQLAKRQVEELAQISAVDFEDFYQARKPARCKPEDLLLISADGKGIVMRPDALPPKAAAARARPGPKHPKTRLASAEKSNYKRIAEIGAVYDATPVPRIPADIIAGDQDTERDPAPGPVAVNKWLTASIVKDAGTVIDQVLDEAERRDPPQSDQRAPRSSQPQDRRGSRHLPGPQSLLPRLPNRAGTRLADRDRDHRRRLPPHRQRPHRHHRSPLGTRRRRSRPQTTRHQSQRQLQRPLATPPRPRTTPHPRIPLPQPHDPPAGMTRVPSEEPHP
jgi:hypothetical protein